MSTLFAFLSYFIQWLAESTVQIAQFIVLACRKIITGVFTLPAWFWLGFQWIMGAVVIAGSATLAAFNVVAGAIHSALEIAQKIPGAPGGNGLPSVKSSGFDNALSVINALFPLDEAMAFLTVYMTALIAVTIIRTVKAWLPRAAGFGLPG